VKESYKKELARSRLKWADHVERMGGDETLVEFRYPEKGGEREERKTQNAK